MDRSHIGACWILFGILFAGFVNNFEQCTTKTFNRRPELDDVVFNQSLIKESGDVESSAGCVYQCVQTEACNMVLYRQTTRTCRAYTEALSSTEYGTPDTGWQYYGVPCQDYRLEHGRPGVHVLTANQSSLCDTAFCNNTSTRTSCLNGERWQEMNFKCCTTTTHHGATYRTMDPYKSYYEVLPFQLVNCSHIHLDVSGDVFHPNTVIIEKANRDQVYNMFIYWASSPIWIIFNTLSSGSFDTEIAGTIAYGIGGRYTIDIEITDPAYKTYMNGTLVMTNLQRLSLLDTQNITLSGFRAIYDFVITYPGC